MRIECLHRDTSTVERQIHEKTHYTRRLDHMLTRLKTNQVCMSHLVSILLISMLTTLLFFTAAAVRRAHDWHGGHDAQHPEGRRRGTPHAPRP